VRAFLSRFFAKQTRVLVPLSKEVQRKGPDFVQSQRLPLNSEVENFASPAAR
jgi:hypothetical protein